jgi:hypothetical protein
MTEITYEGVGHIVRDDLLRAQRRAWTRIASAGSWWTGAERLAIAAETRNAVDCALCEARKEALSPSHVAGDHDSLGDLPGAVVEAIHHIRTDPGRLTRDWYEGILDQGVAMEQYVEMVGVVATTVLVDTFCRGLGVDARALPEAIGGAPRRHRPAGAKTHDHWVDTLFPQDLTERDIDPYSGGPSANIHKAMSLVPEEVVGFFDLAGTHYLTGAQMAEVMVDPRAIDRAQIELLAARVSAINQCVY